MHKRRIRKKIGKRIRESNIRGMQAITPAMMVGTLAASMARLEALKAARTLSPLATINKQLSIADATIQMCGALNKCHALLEDERALTWEQHYRRRMGVPFLTLEKK